MKKCAYILVSVILLFTLALNSFAAIPREDSDRFDLGTGKPDSGIVETRTETKTIKGVSYSAQASGMVRQINAIRKEAGLSALKRDDRMAEAAKQRALEISISFSHTRPDGSKWRTVTNLVNGENLGVGLDNYAGIVGNYTDGATTTPRSFMESPSHRSAILNSDYTRIETFVFETDGELYWVQLFGGEEEFDIQEKNNVN